MATQYQEINPRFEKFISEQKIFFVATAAEDGRVNLSPKGMDSFRVVSPTRILWLNYTGSGNETAAHLLKKSRMTIMFCAFDGVPLILRLYGQAKIYHRNDQEYQEVIKQFNDNAGSRQIIIMDLDLVQKSCGYAVPLMEFQRDRDIINAWFDNKGTEGIEKYWEEKNTKSIDGFETGIGNAKLRTKES